MARVRTPGRLPRRKSDGTCISQETSSIPRTPLLHSGDHPQVCPDNTYKDTVDQEGKTIRADMASAVDPFAAINASGVTHDRPSSRDEVLQPNSEDNPASKVSASVSMESTQPFQSLPVNTNITAAPTFPTERLTAVMMSTFKQTTPSPQLDRNTPSKRARSIQSDSTDEPPKKRGRPSNGGSVVKKRPPGRPRKIQKQARQSKAEKIGQPAMLTPSNPKKRPRGRPRAEPTRRGVDQTKAQSASERESF